MESEYENFKKENGIYLEDQMGTKDWAFNRDNALKALAIMRKENMPCYGGDVIKEKDGNFAFDYKDYGSWYYNRRENETQEQYVANSISEAEKYINNYPERHGNYYYIIVP